jgi:hypothetical protein
VSQFGDDQLKFVERDSMFAAGGAKPLVQDCKKLDMFLFLQPQRLVVTLKVEPQQHFHERILAVALE